MIKFEKVSFDEYKRCREELSDCIEEEKIRAEYDAIKLPKRATRGSAGYDFFAPFSFTLPANEIHMTFPTGIRFVTDRDDIVLLCFPRSGLGFKFGVRLANTTGVIDSDYQYAKNEGHIMLKICATIKECTVEHGQGFMQGVIVPFLKTDDDFADADRDGGFGSTDKKKF